jgi:hypothetical protein
MAKKKVASVEVDTVVNNFGGEFLNLYIPIPAWSVADLPVKKMARMLCEINGFEFPCALRPSEGGDFYISLSKEKAKKSKVMEGLQLKAKLRMDESEYGFPMPEELTEVLSQDPEGKIVFEAMNPGHRRGYLHYIGSAKSVDVRIKRSFQIIERLKEEAWKKKLGDNL